jgi:hypothetical protein
MLSLNALSISHIHSVHTMFELTVLTIAAELAFHSSKMYRDMLLLPSDWSVHGIRQSTKNRPIIVKALSIYTYLLLPCSVTSPNFDNYICTRPSSTQHSDTLQIWMCKDQKDHMNPLHGSRVLVCLPLPQSNSIFQCLSLSEFCFLMLIALAWLVTSAAENCS